MVLSTQELNQFAAQLASLKDELSADIELTQSVSKPVELDQNRQGRLSRMDAMQGQAMAQASLARLEAQLAELHTASERLQSGDFGRCLECDEWIAIARLKFNPCVRYCIECATRFE